MHNLLINLTKYVVIIAHGYIKVHETLREERLHHSESRVMKEDHKDEREE